MHRWILLVALVVGACSGIARPTPVSPRAVRPWETSRRGEGEAGAPADPGGYPDAGDAPPSVPAAHMDDAPSPSGWSEERVLEGRAGAFMRGLANASGTLPLRDQTWSSDAHALAVSADSVEFATDWMPVHRVFAEAGCDGRRRSFVRMVGVFRTRGTALILVGRVEGQAGWECVGRAELRSRLNALMDDLELYGRAAARERTPLQGPG